MKKPKIKIEMIMFDDRIPIKFPISKKKLANLACKYDQNYYASRNMIGHWCRWAENDPVMKESGYKRKNKHLTKDQFYTVLKWARFKYMTMQFKELEDGSHILIVPLDKRLFNNTLLFPRNVEFEETYIVDEVFRPIIVCDTRIFNSTRKAVNMGLRIEPKKRNSLARIPKITGYNRRNKTIQTINHDF